MRPEKKAPSVELEENEKTILEIVKKEGAMDLNVLKDKTGLSNKKWDKGLKALRKHGLVDVRKEGDELTVSVEDR